MAECKSKQGQYIKLRGMVDQINQLIGEAQAFAKAQGLVFGMDYYKQYLCKKPLDWDGATAEEVEKIEKFKETWSTSNLDGLEEYDTNTDWAPSQYC